VGGWFSDDSFLRFDGIDAIGVKYKRQFTPQIAGFVQGQYYFNNEWYVNLAWAFMRKYGVPFTRNGAVLAGNYEFATPAAVAGNTGAYDFVKYSNQIAIALWYRPITAMKFGIQYAYTNDHYFQETGFNAAGACANQGKLTSIGESHRVQFVTFFFF
jgi:hypothetical protein